MRGTGAGDGQHGAARGAAGAKQQHAYSPIIKHAHAHTRVDKARVGIVALILIFAIVTNIVSAVPSQVRSENAGGARSAGFELDSRYALGVGLAAFANLTHTRTRISDNLNPGNDGSQIPFAPDRLANAGLVVPLPGELVVAAYYHWVGRYYDSTDQASRQSFGNYGVINLRAQKVLSRTAGYTALATADLNNLTDRQYRMPFDFRDPGISGFAGVEVRY